MYWSRLRVFLVLITLGVMALVARLAQLQLARGAAYRQEAAANLVREPNLLETRRGAIRDRAGLVLAEDVPRFDLCIYYPFLALEDEAFLRRRAAREGRTLDDVQREMAPLWLSGSRLERFVSRQSDRRNLSDEEFLRQMSELWSTIAEKSGAGLEALDARREKILRTVAAWRARALETQGREAPLREESYDTPGSVPHVLVEGVGDQARAAVAALQTRWPFLEVRERAARRYPYGKLAGQLVGYMSEANEDEVGQSPDGPAPAEARTGAGGSPAKSLVDELRAYRVGDSRGRAGLEAGLENLLRGTRGLERKHRSGAALERVEPVPGRDVVLTLDVLFQSDVESLLDDPPAELPADYLLPRASAVVIDLRTGGLLALASRPRYDPNTFAVDYPDLSAASLDRPLLHRAVAAQLSLGSIFKCVTATAALHEGVVTPQTTLVCHGVLDARFPTWRCVNNAVHGEIQLPRAIRVSCNVYFCQLGLKLGRERLGWWGRRFGFGREVGLNLPGEAAGNLEPARDDARNLAIGQGTLMVTPLQVARMAALVATGGQMTEVHLVQSPPPPLKQVDMGLDPRHMAVIQQALAGVVNEPDGTGYEMVRHPQVRIAGKTGTAQNGRLPDHSWFIGYAPAERPQIAFAVVFEYAGFGSKVAGPVARQIVEAALKRNLINAG